MLIEKRILVNVAKDIAAGDVVSNLVVCRREVPLYFPTQSLGVDTARNIDRFGKLGNGFEGSLNTVLWSANEGQFRNLSLRSQACHT